MNKNMILVSVMVISNLMVQNLFAQKSFATIEKNVNISAKGLIHDLNKTKDTLLLKSDKKINFVYSINKDRKREIENYINSNSHKVPLNNLSKGRHVFVVNQSPLLIVFVIRILNDSPSLASTAND
jgi:hypothetical protein